MGQANVLLVRCCGFYAGDMDEGDGAGDVTDR
jgi:hypothetical protein